MIYIKKELKASFYGGDRMLEKAIIIAASAHQDQVDKGGNPYILHPLAVMLSLEDEIERICASSS